MRYDAAGIQSKWRQRWDAAEVYKVEIDRSRPKLYVLDMFPYPSGAGLHVGHPLGYVATDIYARYKRMCGFNVLHPMGYDAFGLPTEQYAIETGKHPADATSENIARFRQQMDRMGFCYDWSRQILTSDPAYYKWTQWAFIKLFHHWFDPEAQRARPISELEARLAREPGWTAKSATEREAVRSSHRLAYLTESVVNWCPKLGTVLANDEVQGGHSVRGNHPVEQRRMKQWALRVSAYAQRLLDGLGGLDWPDAVKEIQRNWIGRSEGAQLSFRLAAPATGSIPVFTTRPDTIFGCSFLVLAPEHPLVSQLATPERRAEVEAYVKAAAQRNERERQADTTRVTGAFTGAYAEHPFTGEKLPIWTADYVLYGYGTGGIMAVPAHDSRDHAFARRFSLPIREVVKGGADVHREAFEDTASGVLTSSSFLDGLPVPQAIARAIQELDARALGERRISFRLRDATFSRQRFWGEPIPVCYVDGVPQTLPESELPLRLPQVDKFLPTESGDPPLGRAKDWKTKDGHPLEMTTMPGFAGSSAYFLRYMDPHNESALVSRDAAEYWGEVDFYLGGREHATGHLIYSRFWNLFLYDIGVAAKPEPFRRLFNQGMIQGRSSLVYRVKGENRFVSRGLRDRYDVAEIHIDVSLVTNDVLDVERFKRWRAEYADATFELEDGRYLCGSLVEKMSKSLYNVVNPDDVIDAHGADAFRLYEMFLGPLDVAKPWQTEGIEGVARFLDRFWRLFANEDGSLRVGDAPASEDELRILHKLLKKVCSDMEALALNTAVSAFMIATTAFGKLERPLARETLSALARALAPMAPYLCEELWELLGEKPFIVKQAFPEVEERWTLSDVRTYPVSLNGKKRFTIDLPAGLSEAEIRAALEGDERYAKCIEGKAVKRLIIVPERAINVVV